MILNMLGGSSGSSSEIIIVDGLNSPKKVTQNMVWVETDVEMSSCQLSASAPENPIAGLVWLKVDITGVVKVNSLVGEDWIAVYPRSVNQYVNGVWESKIAKIYLDGEWVELFKYLYGYGKSYNDVIGAWEMSGLPLQSGTGGNTGTLTPTVTWAVDYFIYNGTGNHDSYTRSGYLFTGYDVDLTEARTLRFHILSSTVGGSGTNNTHCWIGVFDRSGTHMGENKVATVEIKTEETDKWYDIDVSALSGGYAIGIEASSQARNVVELKVDAIVIE